MLLDSVCTSKEDLIAVFEELFGKEQPLQEIHYDTRSGSQTALTKENYDMNSNVRTTTIAGE